MTKHFSKTRKKTLFLSFAFLSLVVSTLFTGCEKVKEEISTSEYQEETGEVEDTSHSLEIELEELTTEEEPASVSKSSISKLKETLPVKKTNTPSLERLTTPTNHTTVVPQTQVVQSIEVKVNSSRGDDATTSIDTTASTSTSTTQSSNGLRYLGTFEATGYCPCYSCSLDWGRQTASGATATAGRTIATDKKYAFGTIFYIDGRKYVVEDRGGAVKGNIVDIFFDTHQEALNWGRRKVDVYVPN